MNASGQYLSAVVNGGNIYRSITSHPSLTINGTLTTTYVIKSASTFDIPHPLYPATNRRLIHSVVEAPRCDLIYRGSTTLVNGTSVVNINRESTHEVTSAMDDGTFEALCANPQIFLQNNTAYDSLSGSITGAILTITSENSASTDIINWMVLAERRDASVKEWNRTDADGYLVTQYET